MVNAVIAVENVRKKGKEDYWIVSRCSVREEAVPPNTPGFEISIPLCSGTRYNSKHAALNHMGKRIWKILEEKGYRENEEPVTWDIREELKISTSDFFRRAMKQSSSKGKEA